MLLLFHGMPHGEHFWLDVDSDGSVLATGGNLPGRKWTGSDLRAGGMLTRAEAEALRDVIGKAPFAAFRHDPQWRTWEDGLALPHLSCLDLRRCGQVDDPGWRHSRSSAP